MKLVLGCLIVVGLAASAHCEPKGKTLKFWNLTAATITELSMAPAGTNAWSGNLCLSDPDHGVETDERMGLAGIAGGEYDVKVKDAKNRSCQFHAVHAKPEGPYAFSISENDMKTCTPN